MAHATHDEGPKLFGMIAEYTEPEQLVEATKKAYAAGYRKMDGYSPFPIADMSEALHLRGTGVPPAVFLGGVLGAISGFGMAYIASAVHYPLNIGGRPFVSWQSFIPITFELMILFAAFANLGAMLALNGLPLPYHPIFNAKRFERASTDRFFLCIEATDPQYDEAKTRALLEATAPVEVSLVHE